MRAFSLLLRSRSFAQFLRSSNRCFLIVAAVTMSLCGARSARADDCAALYNSQTGAQGYFATPSLTAGESLSINVFGTGTFKIQNTAHTTTYATYTSANAPSGTSYLVATTGTYALYYSGNDQSYVVGCGIKSAASGTITTVPAYAVTAPSAFNFGSVTLPGSATQTLTFTIPGGGTGTIASVSVVTMGAANLDFTQSGSDTCTGKSLATAATCTVPVQFLPLRAGWRKGGVLLKGPGGNILSAAYVQGIGAGAQLAYSYGTPLAYSSVPKANIGSFSNQTRLAVDGNGVLYVPAPEVSAQDLEYYNFPSPYTGTAPASTLHTSGLVYPGYDTETGQNYNASYNPNVGGGTIAAAVDGVGNVYVTGAACDCDGNYSDGIMRIDLSGSTSIFYAYTVPDTGTTPIGLPQALAVGGDGTVYVFSGKYATGDTTAGVNAFNPYTASFTHVAVSGLSFTQPYAAVIDSTGNLYVADGNLNTSYSVLPVLDKITGTSVSTLSLGTTITTGRTFYISGLAIDSLDNLFVTSAGSDTSRSKLIYVLPASSQTNPFTLSSVASTAFSVIGSLAFDAQDNLYVQDIGVYNASSSTARSIYYFPLQVPSLTFAAQAKGTTSAAQSLTLTNVGNAPLSIAVPSSGSNPSVSSNFTLTSNTDSNACVASSSVTIPAASICARFGTCSSVTTNSCTVKVASSPHVSSGSTSGTVTVTGNLSSTESSFALTGSGLPGLVSFSFTGLPSSTPEAASETTTLTALDGSNNTLAGYTGTVYFSLSRADVSAALPSDYTFTGAEGGTKTFAVALSSPGAQSVIATDAADSVFASQSTTVVLPVDHFAFTVAPPSTATAGTSFNVTVTAYSNSGTTVATSYTGPVAFTSTDSHAVFPSGTLNLTNGVGTFAITLKTAGTKTITVADSSGSPSLTSANITVSPAAASVVGVYSGSGQNAIVGNAFANPLVVQTFDAYSNPVGGVSVSFAGPASGASATFSPASCTTSATATPAGSCSVTATANATVGSNYSVTASSTGLTSGTFTLTNSAKTAQTITFTQPASQTFGTTPTLTATSTSSLTLAFSSTTTGVCTVTSGGALTFLTSGTCTINADQAGNSTYAAATTVQRSFTVNAVVPGAPTIGTASGANSQATISFTAPANTGGAAIKGYTVTSSPGGKTGTGSASPITVTGLTNGATYTFTVTAANSAGTGAASAASNSVVPSGAQTITFNNPGTQTYGTTPTLTATASSGLPVVFTSTTTGVCTVTSGGLLSFVSTGTCSINADQPGNGSYNAATTVTQGFSVQAASQTITFTQPTSPVIYGVSPITLTATGGASGNAVTFSMVSGPGTVSGTTLTVTGAGTIVVAADQLGNSNYSAATEVQRSIVVNAASQTITFTQPASPVTYGVSPISLSATGGASGNAVTFSVISGSGTVSGNTLTVTGAGTIVMAADQAGNTNYSAATEVQRSIVVNAASQSITFTQPSTPITYGSATAMALSATGGASGNAVTFTIASGPGTISGATLTITGAGTIVINANQAASANYAAATQVQRSLVVSTAASTLTGPATQPVFVVFSQSGTVPVTITGQYSGTGIGAPGSGTTGNTISYSIRNSSSTSVASGSLTIASGAVSVPVASTLAPGLYTVNASYAGDSNYSAATPISINLQVGQIQPVAAITAPLPALTYGSALGIAATATYNGSAVAGSFTYAATPTGGAGTAVTATTVLPAGSYLLTANFTPTDAVTYKTATTTAPLTVNKATPGVTLTSSVNPLLVQNATTLTATVSSAVSTPGGSVTFYDNTASAAIGAAIPLSNGVASLSVSTLSVGPHSITAIYSGDGNFVTFTSTAVSEQVDDFSLAISTSANSPTSQTILPGGTATFSFTLSPTGTTTFPAAVNLTVTGLPTGATYTITPSILAEGSGSTPVTLTITVPKQTAMLHTGEKLAPFALALLLLPFGGRMRRRAGKLSRLVALLLLIVGGAAGVAALTGCGSTTGFFASPQQTYNVTITGTSGALTHSTTVTLTVE